MVYAVRGINSLEYSMPARTSFPQICFLSKHFAFYNCCWAKCDFTLYARCFSGLCDSALNMRSRIVFQQNKHLVSKHETADPDLKPRFSFVDNFLLFFLYLSMPYCHVCFCSLVVSLLSCMLCFLVFLSLSHIVPWVRCGT